ncbi:unnamed protein product [Gordionus sp. m RMFG-2023]
MTSIQIRWSRGVYQNQNKFIPEQNMNSRNIRTSFSTQQSNDDELPWRRADTGNKNSPNMQRSYMSRNNTSYPSHYRQQE